MKISKMLPPPNFRIPKIGIPKFKSFIALLAGSLLITNGVLAQGESCLNPHLLSVTGEYVDVLYEISENEEDVFISFQAENPAAYFVISSAGQMPVALSLYSVNCTAPPLKTMTTFTDSNNVQSLNLTFYDLEVDSNYAIQVSRDLGQGTAALVFNMGAMGFSMKPGCAPNPCPVYCNKLFNGSFETALQMPTDHQTIHLSKGWMRPDNYGYSADYYHSGTSNPQSSVPHNYHGIQNAVPGLDGDNAYAGLFTYYSSITNFREWMIGTLREPLIQGHRYEVVMHVSLVGKQAYSRPCVGPGLKFSTNPNTHYNNTQIINMVADVQSGTIISDTVDWVKISGEYVAQGGESYVTIANFMNDQESVASSPSGPWTSYFYVDEVSVTDMGACCDNTLVIEDGWNVDDVLNDPSFAPFINGSTLNSVAQVKVEGNFTINKDFTIESTHFVMDAGAGINVSTGQTLTIDNSILDVCGNTMWNGISVNGTSAEVIVSGSEIWEAVKGIHSLNGGKFTVSNSLFDGNNHGIYVSGYDGAHPGTVKSSVFKSSELLLAPYQGNRAAAGIYLEYISDDPNVSGGITIGSPAQSSDENVFHGPGLPTFPGVLAPGLIYGIVSVQSSANIYNNRFTGFVSADLLDPANKAGIKASGITSGDVGNDLTFDVGGAYDFEKNYFINSSKGVSVSGNFQYLGINHNDFNMGGYAGSVAIQHSNSSYHNSSGLIEYNEIVNTEKGLVFSNLSALLGLSIDRNDIYLLSNAPATGIYLNNVQVNGINTFTIANNYIESGTRGIEANDLGGDPEITDNVIHDLSSTVYLSQFGTPLPNYGIRITNSSNVSIVEGNEIVSIPTSNTKVHGISLEMSYANITCNTIEEVGTGVHFGGVIWGSNPWENQILYGNEMKNNHNGLVLTNNSDLNNIGNSSRPSDNRWTGTYTGNHTYTDGADGNLSTLWTRSGGLPYVPQNNGSSINQPLSLNSTASGSTYDCGGIIIGPGGSFAASSVTTTSFEVPDFDTGNLSDTLIWLANYQFYRSIPDDSSITDANMQEYKDSMEQTALGQILRLQEQMNDSSFSMQNEMAILNGLDSLNHMEENMKEVLAILLDRKEGEWDTLPSLEMGILENLALACPFVEGPAVYTSRGILHSFNGKNYSNECELYEDSSTALFRLKDVDITTKEGSDISVYPNPSSAAFNVSILLNEDETAHIHIYDLSGREVMSCQLNNGVNEVNTEKLKAAVYYYSIILNNKILKSDKLIKL